MIGISRKYRCNYIYLSDESVPFQKIAKIADLILRKKLNILWTTYSRIETKFTMDACKEIIRSGCDLLSFGLESANQRVNDLMNKGVSIADVVQNLKVFRKLRFGCAIGAIIGFPGETEEEMQYTADFLNYYIRENKGVVGYISIFSLNAGSYVYNNPQEYGISFIEKADEYFYKENYDFKSANRVPYERMMEIANQVNMQSMSKVIMRGSNTKAVGNRDVNCRGRNLRHRQQKI
jgi:anaerobic magnesium-protoporphyrin IX monomethyl ester cyclase